MQSGRLHGVTRFVALLRAINVGPKGSAGRIPMADMRARTEKLGYDDVATYIQTGNILLSTGDSAKQVTEALEKEFGTRAFVYTRKQLEKAAQDRTRTLSGAPLRSGIVSVMTICSKPAAARFS